MNHKDRASIHCLVILWRFINVATFNAKTFEICWTDFSPPTPCCLSHRNDESYDLTREKIENGRTQGRTATSVNYTSLLTRYMFCQLESIFFHSSRLSNMASYGCIGNCTCPVSDFKGMHLCRFHLLKNQSSQEKPSCPICPILTIWKYCVDTQHYTRMAHVHVPEHLAFCFLLFVESGCASHHLSLSFGMVQSVMKNLAAYACNLYVLLQEPCSIAHSIAVSSWQTLTGLGAGMGTKLFGNPASHSGEKESQGGTSCLQTVRVDVWRSTRNSCKTPSRQATRNQCLLKKSTLNTLSCNVGWPFVVVMCSPFHGGSVCACNPSGPVPWKQAVLQTSQERGEQWWHPSIKSSTQECHQD